LCLNHYFISCIVTSHIWKYVKPSALQSSKKTRTKETYCFHSWGVLAINVLFLVIALIILHHQDWYQCRQWNGKDISLNYGLGGE
jgi:surface polysaccharide O-acyltransferase-like enzyme